MELISCYCKNVDLSDCQCQDLKYINRFPESIGENALTKQAPFSKQDSNADFSFEMKILNVILKTLINALKSLLSLCPSNKSFR